MDNIVPIISPRISGMTSAYLGYLGSTYAVAHTETPDYKASWPQPGSPNFIRPPEKGFMIYFLII